MNSVIVVGAGQAGLSVAAKLRALGYSGSILIIGEEDLPPYERPPLSKGYLLGKIERERLLLRPADFYRAHGIDLVTGKRVRKIDRRGRRVVLDEATFAFDRLVLATGATPRRLRAAFGGGLVGVHVLRTFSDIEGIAADCRPGAKALVIGGGYIGLEAAATFRTLDMSVTLIEVADRILQRVAARETSDFVRALHQSKGVNIMEGVGLTRLTGNGRVTGAMLSNGTELDVDLVLVGIGVEPADRLAADCGLATDGGILVDARGQTSDPLIHAVGDCARFPFAGVQVRLESVQNAVDQAEVAAADMVGAGRDYAPVPWFWSDQYELKLQIAGLNSGYDAVVARAGKRPGSASHWYFRGGRLLAVDAMNEPAAFMLGRRLLEAGSSVSSAEIADPTIDLKLLLRPARHKEIAAQL
jgi:3-phenylpropionate/trans-cinnamate dioxygenase ferredoxin reductase component